MKSNKALRRLAKIEAIISDVSKRYSASAAHVQAALKGAKVAFAVLKEAVSSDTSSGPVKKPLVKASGPKTTPEPAKTKRKLSPAGKRANQETVRRRGAQKRATAKADQATKKAAPARKKAAVAPAAMMAKRSAPIKNPAKKIAAKKTGPAPMLNTSAPAQTAPAPVQTATELAAPGPMPAPPRV